MLQLKEIMKKTFYITLTLLAFLICSCDNNAGNSYNPPSSNPIVNMLKGNYNGTMTLGESAEPVNINGYTVRTGIILKEFPYYSLMEYASDDNLLLDSLRSKVEGMDLYLLYNASFAASDSKDILLEVPELSKMIPFDNGSSLLLECNDGAGYYSAADGCMEHNLEISKLTFVIGDKEIHILKDAALPIKLTLYKSEN